MLEALASAGSLEILTRRNSVRLTTDIPTPHAFNVRSFKNPMSTELRDRIVISLIEICILFSNLINPAEGSLEVLKDEINNTLFFDRCDEHIIL